MRPTKHPGNHIIHNDFFGAVFSFGGIGQKADVPSTLGFRIVHKYYQNHPAPERLFVVLHKRVEPFSQLLSDVPDERKAKRNNRTPLPLDMEYKWIEVHRQHNHETGAVFTTDPCFVLKLSGFPTGWQKTLSQICKPVSWLCKYSYFLKRKIGPTSMRVTKKSRDR